MQLESYACSIASPGWRPESRSHMTPEILAALALLVGGLIAYVPTSGRFMRDYQGRYGKAPARSWMFRAVDDPEIERWRRYAAISLAANLVGVMLVFVTTTAA